MEQRPGKRVTLNVIPVQGRSRRLLAGSFRCVACVQQCLWLVHLKGLRINNLKSAQSGFESRHQHQLTRITFQFAGPAATRPFGGTEGPRQGRGHREGEDGNGQLALFRKVDPAYGEGVAEALRAAATRSS